MVLLGALGAAATDDAYVVGVDEVRGAAAIRTYRLEKAYYDHLMEVARRLAAARGVDPERPVRVEGIDEPARPIVPLAGGDAPPLGDANAPVRLIVVENLAQVYTPRLDALLQRLRSRYGPRLVLLHRDFVDRTHRRSRAVAVAARCAARQGRFWEYRALAVGHLEAQERADLVAHAETLSLDVGAFTACLEDPGVGAAAEAESAAAQAAGITNAPVLLVNGRYVRGVEDAAVVEHVVADAMPAADDGGPPPETALPLRLTGVVLVPEAPPRATIASAGIGQGRTYEPGDHVRPDVVVTAIERDHVLLRHGGRTERLSLGRDAGGAAADAGGLTDRALVPDNASVQRLGHADVERILAHRSEMEAQLAPAPLDLGDGRRLLTLTGERHLDLFARLGLQPRDVVLRVNGAFVYAGANPLFDVLEAGGPATIVVMRRGIPYRIDLEVAH